MKTLVKTALVFFLGLAATGFCQPAPNDFAYGIALETPGESAIYRLETPDAVYNWIMDPALGDVRIFNGGEQVVPHTLLKSPSEVKSIQPVYTESALPLFPVLATADGRESSVNIRIETDGKGALVNINGGAQAGEDSYISYYILDVSAFMTDDGDRQKRLDLLTLEWSHTENGFVSKVDVFAGSDLSNWRRIAHNAALADMTFGEHKLIRNEIPLPGSMDKYLKLTWPKGKEGAVLNKVVARFRKDRKKVAKTEPKTRTMDLQAVRGEEPQEYLFQCPGRFPVQSVEVALPQKNTLVKASLFCRDAVDRPWAKMFSGLIYDLNVDGTRIANETITFEPKGALYWKLAVNQGEGGMGPGLPAFKIGYQPHTICFVAQGEPPFTLAFGSYKYKKGDALVDPLLSGLSLNNMPNLIKPANPGREFELGGQAALTPPKPPLPWKRIILWAVLCLGAVVVAFMAWKLSRQMPDKQ
ncbi:Protein of unknown function [Desulfatibacillum alkenivorans DSM 16219]|jgi:hypothetical protein|uniref:DUF3999 domain-containing protein n=1 Tax=Desulfatibacillum alkenivorans DSM 16219 TaxID=1121393 RepID=A0A1M6NZI9_9BACT|nr:DUF3999 domain-containing protein [Desulfatibacillum alkenivorans]SHK01081.1 Protein of unknown function [Desulfatibacillum alkenivorans DSM 16219]